MTPYAFTHLTQIVRFLKWIYLRTYHIAWQPSEPLRARQSGRTLKKGKSSGNKQYIMCEKKTNSLGLHVSLPLLYHQRHP